MTTIEYRHKQLKDVSYSSNFAYNDMSVSYSRGGASYANSFVGPDDSVEYKEDIDLKELQNYIASPLKTYK